MSPASTLGISLAVVQVESLSTVLSLLEIEPDTLLLVAHPPRLRPFLRATRSPPVLVHHVRTSPLRTGVSPHSANVVSSTQAAPRFAVEPICLAVSILSPGSFASATTLRLIYSGGHPSCAIGSLSAFPSLLAA